MRPDEHKRKKNAAYKKKHGIGNNNASSLADNATTETGTGTGDKKSKKDHRLKHQTNPPHASNNSPNTKDPASNPKGPSDSDSDNSEVVDKKSFGRRQIVSNWKKYDLEPESNGAVTSRGEDFEKLLSMAGEAMSRFRFKDELEWEGDSDRLGEGDDAEQYPTSSAVFSLDLADISSSMSCIPINELLRINQSLFPTDQLESHIQSVTEKRKEYNEMIRLKEEQSKSLTSRVSHDSPVISPRDLKDKSPSTQNQAAHKNSKESVEHNIHEKVENKTKEMLTVDKVEGNSIHEVVKDKTLNGIEMLSVNVRKEQIHRHDEPSMSLEDEDLDQLLDMDMKQEEVIGAGKQGVAESSTRSNNDNIKEPKDDAKTEVDELEDWLDSILD